MNLVGVDQAMPRFLPGEPLLEESDHSNLAFGQPIVVPADEAPQSDEADTGSRLRQIGEDKIDDGDGVLTQEILDAVVRTESIEQAAQVNPRDDDASSSNTHVLQVFHFGEPLPQIIRVHEDTTVGSITVAEDRLGSMQQPVQVKNSVGVPVRLSDHTTPHQSLFLREMHSYGTDSHDDRPAIFDSPVPLSRLALLNAQEAWVANDEMEHHLQRLTLTGLAVASGPCLLPRLYADEFL
eukprot:s5262_g1.t1